MPRLTGELFAVLVVGVLYATALNAAEPRLNQPIALNPRNPHYFLFRGRTTVLVGSSEHYGSVINLEFDYLRYLNAIKASGLNATRVFSGVYRELQSDVDAGQAGNVLAPEPASFIAPWPRANQPGAADGLNKFDLTRWNEAYFERLKEFVGAASQRGIVVEFVLFSNYYDESHWSMSPLNVKNNINGVGSVALTDSLSLKEAGLVAAEDAFVTKVVTELSSFDNLYFEICNEPFHVKAVREWESHIAATIVRAESSRPRHLIAQEGGFAAKVVTDRIPETSILMFHVPRAAQVLLNQEENIPIGANESGFDGRSDAPYRIESWQYLMAGGAEAMGLDYSFTAGHEDGSYVVPAGQLGGGSAVLRRQLGILLSFVGQLDLIDMAPMPSVIKGGLPKDASAYVLGKSGRSYVIYLHHGHSNVSNRQLSDLEEGVTDGLDLSGHTHWYVVDSASRKATLAIDLPRGAYIARWMNTKTGGIERTDEIQVLDGPTALTSPVYSEDIAVRIDGIGHDYR